MSKARELADVIGTQDTTENVLQGRKNLIINGAMQVAQRGTSFSGFTASSAVYPVDRMKSNGRSGQIGTWTISQDADAPSGFGSSVKYLCTTADTSLSTDAYMSFQQEVEGYNCQPLNDTTGTKAFTISFWVKSNKTGTYVLEFNNNDDARKINKAYTIDTSDTWEYKTINIPADSGYFFDNDNGGAAGMFFWLLAGTNYTTGSLNDSWSSSTSADSRAVGVGNLADATNNYWQITGVQLEVGSVATPFEHRSYGEELALCQRYYQYSGDGIQAGFAGDVGAGMISTGQLEHAVRYPIKMRAAPSLTLKDGGGNVGKVSRLNPGVAWNDNSTGNVSNNSDTGHWLYSPSGSNGATLVYFWYADAEL